MPTASKKDRQIRLLKRERSQAFKLLEYALDQRDVFRSMTQQLMKQIEELKNPKPVEETIEQDNQTDRQNENGDGLEVSQS